ncbi:MAG TPA: hypothetical protein VF875_16725 [Anaeromyxobacter sp.]
MPTWLPITYREFYDVPRVFTVAVRGEWLLFDCPFDEASDEYGTDYIVYALPVPPPSTGSWAGLAGSAHQRGTIGVSAVTFDSTKRTCVGEESIEQFLSATP